MSRLPERSTRFKGLPADQISALETSEEDTEDSEEEVEERRQEEPSPPIYNLSNPCKLSLPNVG